MTSLQQNTQKTSPSLNSAEEVLAVRLHETFAKIGPLVGLDIALRSAGRQKALILRDGKPVILPVGDGFEENSAVDGSEMSLVVPLQDIDILLQAPADTGLAKLAEALVRETTKTLEAERREELLLEEVAANWESLDALYEISSAVLTLGNVTDAVKGLISRLASLKDSLEAALFVVDAAELKPLACSQADPQRVPLTASGAIQQIFQGRRALVLNQLSEAHRPQPSACWHAARNLAAAPVTLQSAVIGCVIVWTESRDLNFDTPFSRLVETLSRNISLLLECDSLTQTVRENERLAQDVEIASTIQETLLTCEAPPDFPGLELAAFTVPSQRIDGDFYEFYPNQNQFIDVLVGDVMGKGVAAALLGVAAKQQFMRVLAAPVGQAGRCLEPAEIVSAVSAGLNRRLIELERFITLNYARFDTCARELRFVDCGHTSTVVHRKQTGETILLRGEDLPLGIQGDQQYTQQTFPFEPGDTFLFYSDGVTENRSADGEFFGDERLIEFVETWSSLGPDALIGRLRRDAKEFCGRDTFSDDFTCIAARIGLNEGEPLQILQAEFPCQVIELERSRDWLIESAEAVPGGLGEEALIRLQLACGEAIDNCIIHGSKSQVDSPVKVKCCIYSNSLTIDISHRGPAYDPFAVPPPSFDGSRDNGFGLFIISRSADELTYRREADGTNVISISIVRKRMTN